MKLSEAIRLGAMLKPQGFGPTAAYSASVKTCALGAAAEAAGMKKFSPYRAIRRMFPIADISARCPECPYETNKADAISVIWHLNDYHRWSREQISVWVATIEAQHPQLADAPAVEQAEQPEAVSA